MSPAKSVRLKLLISRKRKAALFKISIDRKDHAWAMRVKTVPLGLDF